MHVWMKIYCQRVESIATSHILGKISTMSSTGVLRRRDSPRQPNTVIRNLHILRQRLSSTRRNSISRKSGTATRASEFLRLILIARLCMRRRECPSYQLYFPERMLKSVRISRLENQTLHTLLTLLFQMSHLPCWTIVTSVLLGCTSTTSSKKVCSTCGSKSPTGKTTWTLRLTSTRRRTSLRVLDTSSGGKRAQGEDWLSCLMLINCWPSQSLSTLPNSNSMTQR